jgi:RNA polymerase sigma factor (sigma-70 family)
LALEDFTISRVYNPGEKIYAKLGGPLDTLTLSLYHGPVGLMLKLNNKTGEQERLNTAAHWFVRSEALIRHALSRYLNRSEDIQDLAQEVYLRLLRVPEPELVRHPNSYLYRIATNVAREWLLHAQQAKEHSPEWLESLAASEDNPETSADQSERDRVVHQMLHRLPVRYRTAVVLHAYEALTYDEVAVRMGVSKRAVKRYVANGYAQLKEELTELREPSELGKDHGKT